MIILLLPFKKIMEFLKYHSNPEWEQAIIRLIVGLLIAGYVFFWVVPQPHLTYTFIYFVSAALVSFGVSISILLHIAYFPLPIFKRRILGITHDMLIITCVMALTGEYGAPVYAVYLWVIPLISSKFECKLELYHLLPRV